MAWSVARSRTPKVGLAVPSKDYCSQEWAMTLAQVTRAVGTAELMLFTNGHWELDYARNDLVEMSRAHGCTHTMFLDNDIFPTLWVPDEETPAAKRRMKLTPFPSVVDYFLQMEYPIVSCLYWGKRGHWVAGLRSGTDAFAVDFLRGKAEEYAGVHLYVDVVGMGAVLIDNRVFDRVPYPWFHYFRSRERGPDGKFREFSEDLFFGVRASEAGFPTMVVGEVLGVHKGDIYHTGNGDGTPLPPW
jgi:hypothetical protein